MQGAGEPALRKNKKQKPSLHLTVILALGSALFQISNRIIKSLLNTVNHGGFRCSPCARQGTESTVSSAQTADSLRL